MAIHTEQSQLSAQEPDLGTETYVTRLEPKESASGRSYIIVHFADGRKAFNFNAHKLRVAVGDYGVPTLIRKEKNGNTYYDLASWHVTKPASQGTVTPSGERIPVHTEQAIWDAKDRGMDMQSAQKTASRIVSAMIEAGAFATEKDALVAAMNYQLSVAAQLYGQMQMARTKQIATASDPFANE